MWVLGACPCPGRPHLPGVSTATPASSCPPGSRWHSKHSHLFLLRFVWRDTHLLLRDQCLGGVLVAPLGHIQVLADVIMA